MMEKKLIGIGNSTGLVFPQSILDAVGLQKGDNVVVTVHGRRLIIELAPVRRMTDEQFQAAFEAVLERHAEGFQKMDEFDRTGERGGRRAR